MSFTSDFHTVQHDFGSLNNSPENFTITLFSNDKRAERVSQQSSVRSQFSTAQLTRAVAGETGGIDVEKRTESPIHSGNTTEKRCYADRNANASEKSVR